MAEVFDASTSSLVDTYTEIGPRYQDAFHRVPAQVRSLQWITSQLQPRSRVLDVGCGTGQPACFMFAQAGFDVTGVDITPKMVEAAKAQVPQGHFFVADGRTWEPPAEDPKFDGIVSNFAFLAAVTKADIRAFFRRAHSWLRPGGFFVYGTITEALDKENLKWLGRDVVVSNLGTEECLSEIEKAGFVVEEHEVDRFLPNEVGLCKPEDLWEEEHLFVYCRKSS